MSSSSRPWKRALVGCLGNGAPQSEAEKIGREDCEGNCLMTRNELFDSSSFLWYIF
jgi:hypothetical protein